MNLVEARRSLLPITLPFRTRVDLSAAQLSSKTAVSLSPEGFDRVDAGSAPGGNKAGSAGDSQSG